MLNILSKYRFIFSFIGVLATGTFLCFWLKDFKVTYSNNIWVRENIKSVYDITINNVAAMFPEASGVYKKDKILIVSYGGDEVRYDFSRVPYELFVLQKSFVKQEVKFDTSDLGTLITMNYTLSGIFSYFYNIFYAQNIKDDIANSLFLLKKIIEN